MCLKRRVGKTRNLEEFLKLKMDIRDWKRL